MNVQNILSRIEATANEDAQALLTQARERALRLEEQTQLKIEEERLAAVEEAKARAADVAQRLKSEAALQTRKDDLADKRAVLEEAFAQALAKMNHLPEETARKHGLDLLLRIGQGDEEIIPSAQSSWCDENFIAQVNKAFAESGRMGGFALSKSPRDLPSGGFILKKRGMEQNCTYQALLALQRIELEQEVAARLFL